jgi:hypothetical protein
MIKDSAEDLLKRVGDGSSVGKWIVDGLRSTDKVKQSVAIAQALVALDDDRVVDKWGDAGCIEVERGKHYLFFGWASM